MPIGGGFGGGGGFPGSSGAKFALDFSIEGAGEEQLQNILKSLLDVEKAGVGVEIMEKLAEAGHDLTEAGVKVIEAWGGAFEVLLHKGSEFEQMMLRIQATGKTGEQARQLVKDAVAFTTQLPITEGDAIRIMTTMATAHIDALKPLGPMYAELAAKGKTLPDLPQIMGMDRMQKEGPRAITIIGDMLASLGHLGSAYQPMAIHEMMEFIETGMARSPMTFGPMITDIRRIGKTAHTAADRIKGMMELLEKRGALGISQAAMSTFGGVMSNFKGLVDKVTIALMEPGKPGGAMSQFNQGLMNLYNTISEFFDESTARGRAFIGAMREVFHTLISWITTGMEKAGAAIRYVFDFMASHPVLVKFAALASIAGAALMIFLGVVTVVTAGVVGLMLVLAAAPEILLAIPIAVGLVIASLGGLVLIIAAATAAYELWEHDFAGIRTFFEDLALVIGAVQEAIKTWHYGMAYISEDTANKLEKAGVTKYFLDIVHWIREAQVFWGDFTTQLQVRWKDVSKAFKEAYDEISGAFQRIGEAIGVIFDMFTTIEDGNKDVGEAASAGKTWADKVATVADQIAKLTKNIAKWVDDAMGSVPDLIDGFASLYEAVVEVKGAVSILSHVFVAFLEGLAGALGLLLTPLELIVRLFMGVIEAKQVFDKTGKWDFTGLKEAFTTSTTGAAAVDLFKRAGGNLAAGADVLSDADKEEKTIERMHHKAQELRTHPRRLLTPAEDEGKGKERAVPDVITGAQPPITINLKADVHLDGKKVGEIQLRNTKDAWEQNFSHVQTEAGPI